MSAKDLFGGDLPSDDESEDEDYVSEGSADDSSSSSSGAPRFQQSVQTQRIANYFSQLKQSAESNLLAEHADVCVDPLMLLFQQRVEEDRARPTTSSVMAELRKFSDLRVNRGEGSWDIRKFKSEARQVDEEDMAACAAEARAGLAGAQIEVEEQVRFAGEVVTLKKMVERTSTHAARLEKRKRAGEQQSAFQTYLNQIKSKRAVSSVEKSAADWNMQKMASEELERNLKSGRGFIENQAFLARAEVREDDRRRDVRRRG